MRSQSQPAGALSVELVHELHPPAVADSTTSYRLASILEPLSGFGDITSWFDDDVMCISSIGLSRDVTARVPEVFSPFIFLIDFS